MLVLRPKGRGNWRTLTVSIKGDRASPLLIRRGQEITLGGVTFRISKVIP